MIYIHFLIAEKVEMLSKFQLQYHTGSRTQIHELYHLPHSLVCDPWNVVLNFLPFRVSVPELIVQGSWSCVTRTLSSAKGKRTSDVRTLGCGWCSECTSTSPMAGQCPCRLHPTPLNAVSLTHEHTEKCTHGTAFSLGSPLKKGWQLLL